MGTHVKAPSGVEGTSDTLSTWLDSHPGALGQGVQQQFCSSNQLPYLFKVLSVKMALSIQAHPNKLHAERLHEEHPDKYPDPNHKPEMAIALTTFEALCGFRPLDEFMQFVKNIPELAAVIGEAEVKSLCATPSELTLQQCFTALFNTDTEAMQKHLSDLVNRLQEMESRGEDTKSVQGELLLRLHSQFPGDVGCFVSYFLNHMVLQPGEAIYLEANLPHAYLSGDCIECMACSDNVVRAGLTPKFKDVETLCKMLDYRSRAGQENRFQPVAQDSYVTVYDPPVPDFTVAKIQIPKSVNQYTLKSVPSASILLVIEGTAQVSSSSDTYTLSTGKVLFISAEENVELQDVNDLLMFRAYCNISQTSNSEEKI